MNSRMTFRRLLMGCVVSIAVAANAFAQEEHAWNFEDIDGNKIAWSCAGQGEPTIVLVAGMGLSAHDSFRRTYHNYDGPGRICMYDRAGMGKSTFANRATRTMEQLVGELHELQQRRNWNRVMLVAHSFGGFIARAYVDAHPQNVAGILFLDAPQEDWLPRLKQKMPPADWAIMERILQWNIKSFGEDYEQGQEVVRASRFPAGLPITVITRGLMHSQIRLEKMSYAGIDLFDGEHKALQEKLTKLSPRSEHRIAKYASHVIDDYDPWLIIEEIKMLAKRMD
jgi:pimeloyl-ACP methyl ester carboxylesterase